MAPRNPHILRPKRPADEMFTDSLPAPAPAPVQESLVNSPAVSAPDTASSPSTVAPEQSDRRPLPPLRRLDAWPSQLSQNNSTMWLLPLRSNQASAIATLLRAEINSHNITREMLYTTEQRRLEAVQRYSQLLAVNGSWATAYKNLTATLCRCSEEYSRLSAKNAAFRSQLRGLNAQTLYPLNTQMNEIAPEKQQIQVHAEKLVHPVEEDIAEASVDKAIWETVSHVSGHDLEKSPCSQSP